MRIKENEKVYKDIYRCFNCNGCVGRWPEEQCPVRFIHRGSVMGMRGFLHVMQRVIEGDIPLSENLASYLYTCTLCSDCTQKCQDGIDMLGIGRAVRADLVDAGFGPRPEHTMLIQNMKNYDNPWGLPRTRRTAWARGLDAPEMSKKKDAKVLYYVGCTAASDPDAREMATRTVSILKRAEVDFAILGNDEKCCGSTTHWLGDEKTFKAQASANLEQLNSLNVETVITSCAGCYNMLKVVYPEVIGKPKFEVLHTVEYLDKQRQQGDLVFANPINAKLTYHDPCHLGKHVGVYDAPRNLLKNIPGIHFIEMGRIRENSWCCGAGGGVRTAYQDNALKIATERIKEAEALGVDTLVSACPFCYQNLSLAIKSSGSKLKFMDITEMVDMAMKDMSKEGAQRKAG